MEKKNNKKIKKLGKIMKDTKRFRLVLIDALITRNKKS